MLGLRLCVRAFSSCGKQGPLLTTVRGPLTIVASPVAEHRLQTRRFSNCGSQAYLLCGTWDPPGPGIEPASPAPAGRLSTTVPPGKPPALSFLTSTIDFMKFVSSFRSPVLLQLHTACPFQKDLYFFFYMFQVYSIIIWHLNILQGDHH